MGTIEMVKWRQAFWASASVIAAATCALAQTPEEMVREAAGKGDGFLPDFSYAGYGFGAGIPEGAKGSTLIDPADFGALPDDGQDDSAGLLAALEAARGIDGPVTIRLAAGRYLVTEVLDLDRSDLVVEGAGQGAGGTEVHFPRPLAMVDTGARYDELRTYLERYDKRQREADRNLDVLFSEYSWTGGFIWVGPRDHRAVAYLEEMDTRPRSVAAGVRGQRGGLTLTLDDASDVAPGSWIEVMWYSDSPESGIIHSIYGDTDLEIGSHHWSFPDRPLVRQRTKVVKVEGNRLYLASPLPHPVSDDVPAEIGLWQPITNVGIEELRFTFPEAAVFGHHVERGYNAVYFTGAADGWMRNVTVTNADAGILTDDAAQLTFKDLRFNGTRKGHYALHMGSVYGVLADGIEIMSPVIHSLTFNTRSVRSVYRNAEVWSEPVIDQHAGSNHQNLFDRVTLHLSPERDEGDPHYDVFDGSGAGYWQPGHGRYNTLWNLRLFVEGGMATDETLGVRGLAEGPDARVAGLHANRTVALDYRPSPLVVSLGEEIVEIPSLYTYQLRARLSDCGNGRQVGTSSRGSEAIAHGCQ